MSLDKYWAAQDWAAKERLGGWKVERRGDDVFLALQAPSDGERYRVRIRCDGYPERPPSVKFVDDAGSENVPRAWPKGGAIIKPPSECFLCTDLTREGIAHHKDWASNPKAWRNTKTVLDVINMLVELLRGGEYHGRGA